MTTAGKPSPSIRSRVSPLTGRVTRICLLSKISGSCITLIEDFSECHDLAAQYPDKLQELIGLWFAQAGKYDVFPLHSQQMKGQRPKPFPARDLYVYYPGTSRIDNEAAVNVRMRPFSVVAHAIIPEGGAEGVLIAQGGRFAGWSFFVKDGKLVYEHNFLGLERYRVTSRCQPSRPVRLPWG